MFMRNRAARSTMYVTRNDAAAYTQIEGCGMYSSQAQNISPRHLYTQLTIGQSTGAPAEYMTQLNMVARFVATPIIHQKTAIEQLRDKDLVPPSYVRDGISKGSGVYFLLRRDCVTEDGFTLIDLQNQHHSRNENAENTIVKGCSHRLTGKGLRKEDRKWCTRLLKTH